MARLTLIAVLLAVTSGCTFYTNATEWNGRLGANGKPVNITGSTKVGFKFLIALPFLGDMDIDGLVADMTAHVKSLDGDRVRVIQAAQENYWYGFPPFTWILTPVISTVTADYEFPPAR
jgi:hypothetical protein